MKYLYYPGCSLEGTAREYDMSVRALMSALRVELEELKDWTCCGASAAVTASEWLALALSAKNLSIAESMRPGGEILVPCSACYLNLKTAEKRIRKEPDTLERLAQVLPDDPQFAEATVTARHLLDVLSRDIGPERIGSLVQNPLTGYVFAPYYGCQCLRPFAEFDNPEEPRSMEPLLMAAGAGIHPWRMGGKCCGASHMNTKMDVAIVLVSEILKAARGADAIVTVCPMCQMNLEGFQKKVSHAAGLALNIPVLYLPQVLGMAMGISEKDLGTRLNLSTHWRPEKRMHHHGETVQ